MAHEWFEDLLASLKKAAHALRRRDVPFLLAGGLASYARGGPPTEHDIDLMVRPADAERALDALREAGMRIERPPETWLYKAWDGDMLIDVIFEPVGIPVDDGMFERGEEIEVEAVRMRVLSPEDVMITKLLSLNSHHADYSSVLEVARALREQVDWEFVRSETSEWPFAKAFFTLVDELGVTGSAPAGAGLPLR